VHHADETRPRILLLFELVVGCSWSRISRSIYTSYIAPSARPEGHTDHPASPNNMSQPTPNIALPDDKTEVTPPIEKEDVSKTEVLSSGLPSQDPVFLAFDTKDAEWHKAFEKKLMRKVDMRLIPLLITMYLNNFVGRSRQD
jgi:hypothetical protein